MPFAKHFALFSVLIPLSISSASQEPSVIPELIGSWEWTRLENSCTEVYTFTADGRVGITSGAEVSENLYVVLGQSADGRRFQLDIATISENGKKDCGDVAADDSGTSHPIWIEFSTARDKLIMCNSESGFECFGPLVKKRGI